MQILSTKTLFSAITKNLKLETLVNLVTKYSYYLVTTKFGYFLQDGMELRMKYFNIRGLH